jgi:dUTP pyrophosphatase
VSDEEAMDGPDGTELRIERLVPEAVLPAYAHPGDAGLDLTTIEDALLAPGERRALRTGLRVAVPAGHVGLVHPRSGLAARHGVTVANAPGTVDAGYRGELLVLLVNLGDAPVTISCGERVAQLVVQRVTRTRVVEVERLDGTARGDGGFGSTGR